MRVALASAGALALATQFAVGSAHASPTSHSAALVRPAAVANPAAAPASYTAAQVLAGIQAHSTSATQVNTKPHINTMTRAMNVNVYQPAPGVYTYTSSLAVDDDGSDPDPDPDHQGETTFQDSNGKQLAAHHVPFFVLGDDCWDKKTPCPHFFYKDHNIKGREFALMFYKGKVIGSIFGDTQTGNSQTTSENDSRELGEASVKAASLLGIPSSGTTGGVDNGVTVAVFSGPNWVVNGANADLNNNAQALVQQGLDTLGAAMDGGSNPPPPTGTLFEAESGTLSSGGTFDSNHTGFTGTGFANTANAVGAYVDIPVTVDTAGTKTLTFRYSDGTTSARSSTVSVNSTPVGGTLNFPTTADWNTWSTVSVTASLTAGTNTIRLTAKTADGDANIDSVTVS